MNTGNRRLTRCTHDRKILGVASGMAEYLDLDPTIVRVAWVLATFLGGFTIPLYVILAFVMPNEPDTAPAFGAAAPAPAFPSDAGSDGAAGEPGTGPGFAAPGFAAPGFASASSGPAPAHHHRSRGGSGNLGFVFGVLLVVFGTLALIGPAIPGWVGGIHLGPAFILALGIALVVGAARRDSAAS